MAIMAKKRRKLSKELEGEISKACKKVELITAIINDIQEEDIQTEYRTAFDPVRNTYLLLTTLYFNIHDKMIYFNPSNN